MTKSVLLLFPSQSFKSFCITKETIDKMKRQPLEREKIFANEATEKSIQTAHAAQFKIKKKNLQNGQKI